MKKYIVITSIFEPTEAVEKFAKIDDYHVIVVGDKKSPAKYEVDNVTFLNVDKSLGFNIETALPYNHYCRKMIGYLYAMNNDAGLIADSDDDNIPYDDWKCLEFDDEYLTIENNSGFINIYEYFTDKKIWPRGLPLNCINEKKLSKIKKEKAKQKIGVWQGLADKSPDVDAIYRLIDDEECFFDKKEPIALDKGTYCPYNSQNTFYRKELFPLMYLPATVTFRYTDILRGLVAQPILHLYDYKLGFFNATVIQERNFHDYFKDFKQEVPVYLTAQNVIDIVYGAISKEKSVSENLYLAYNALYENDIVTQEELTILQAWLKDIDNINKKVV